MHVEAAGGGGSDSRTEADAGEMARGLHCYHSIRRIALRTMPQLLGVRVTGLSKLWPRSPRPREGDQHGSPQAACGNEPLMGHGTRPVPPPPPNTPARPPGPRAPRCSGRVTGLPRPCQPPGDGQSTLARKKQLFSSVVPRLGTPSSACLMKTFLRLPALYNPLVVP